MALFHYRNYSKNSDEELMLYLTNGKEKAFDELYERYAKKLLYFFYQKLADENKANDFLQDLFLKIIEQPEKFDSSKKFSSWIYSVAHNMCKNEFRNENNRIVNHNFIANNIEEVDKIPFFCEIDLNLFNPTWLFCIKKA